MSSDIILGRNFKFERIPVYVIRMITKVLSFPFTFLRESALKNDLRRLVLRFQNSLPIELAVNRGDVVIQIGTPRWRTVRRFLRSVGENGRVVVVEAEPSNIERLKINSKNVGNFSIVEGAAWSANCEGELCVSPFSGDHKIAVEGVTVDNDLREGNFSMKRIQCQFYKLDDICSQLEIANVDYLSVTVNGAELEVLKGFSNMLSSNSCKRVYAKGHSIDNYGRPLNVSIREYLSQFGYKSIKTKGEPSSTMDAKWRWRAGDVFAWL